MKKLLYLVLPLTTVLLLSACQKSDNPITSSEEITSSEDTTSEKDLLVKSGKAKFKATEDEEIDYLYKDEYFLQDSTVYNPDLRNMAFAFTLAAFDKEEGEDKSKNLTDLFADLFFKNKETFDYNHGKDTIGTNIAYREFVDKEGHDNTVLAVVMDGFDYKKEWASNMTVGTEGDHKGFSDSSLIVEERITNYISTHEIDISKTKLLLTGFSRGAAVANIVAGEINAAISHEGRLSSSPLANFALENVYAYTFATPRGVLLENVNALSQQGNIFNTVLDSDLVTYIALSKDDAYTDSGWDFERYGTDINLSVESASDELIARVNEIFTSYNLKDLTYVASKEVNKKQFDIQNQGASDTNPVIKTTPVTAIKELVDGLTSNEENKGLLSREKFAYCQESLRAFTSFYFSMDDEGKDNFKKAITDYISENGLNFLLGTMPEILDKRYEDAPTDESKCADYCPKTLEFVTTIFTNLGINTEENMAQVEIHLPRFVYLISGVLAFALNADTETNESKLMTIIGNSESILSSHYPEVYRAWIEATGE